MGAICEEQTDLFLIHDKSKGHKMLKIYFVFLSLSSIEQSECVAECDSS